MNVDEGILGNELLQAMKSAPLVAKQMINSIPPQILASPGFAPIPALGFPGAPSGVRFGLQRLDRRYRRELDDEEQDALTKFYATERKGTMRDYLNDFETNLAEAEVRSNLFM